MQEHQPSESEQGWEAEPRDGPAVLVLNIRQLDERKALVGGWVRLDRPPEEVADQIDSLMGDDDVKDYAVVDQLGLGMIMWDEKEVAGLLVFAKDFRRG